MIVKIIKKNRWKRKKKKIRGILVNNEKKFQRWERIGKNKIQRCIVECFKGAQTKVPKITKTTWEKNNFVNNNKKNWNKKEE